MSDKNYLIVLLILSIGLIIIIGILLIDAIVSGFVLLGAITLMEFIVNSWLIYSIVKEVKTDD